MRGRDTRDIVGGSVLVIVGLIVALYASSAFEVGTARRMGPGMFPVALGYLQAGIGLLILAAGVARQGHPIPAPDMRSVVTIIGAGAVFTSIVGSFGVVPAIVLMTVVASAADDRLTRSAAVSLGILLAAAAALTFRFALGIRVVLFDWPFG